MFILIAVFIDMAVFGLAAQLFLPWERGEWWPRLAAIGAGIAITNAFVALALSAIPAPELVILGVVLVVDTVIVHAATKGTWRDSMKVIALFFVAKIIISLVL
jgi:hypothetical protein